MTKQVLQQALEVLELAVRQNSHDMLMTGEEIRKGESAIEALRSALAQQGEQQPVNSGEFAKWYWKACDSSQPDDWMMAALAAQRILATSRPDEAAPAPQAQQSDDYMRGFHDGMKEAPTGECWIRVIDEAMVGAHLGVADMADDYGTAKEKLNTLICWSVEADRESVSHPDTRTVVQQMVYALGSCVGDSLLGGQQRKAAIAAGQKLLKELK